ncbi:MAG: sugar ABC transporter permease [Clostridia bacterium]|nr:sugar ABC transporter permease [Clostridia bacterium]
MARKKDVLIKNRNLWGWIFSIQTVIAILVTLIYPLVYAGVLSFTNVRFTTVNFEFVGFDNYKWLFTESAFFADLWVSIAFAVVSTAVQTVLGFLLAFMLYFMKGKVQGFFKTALYLPVILPTAVVSSMWMIILAGDEFGVLNVLFGLTDPPFQWLGDKTIAFWAIVIINTWRYYGITMVIYLVNMSAVPKEVVESAEVEGASRGQIMLRIIIPLVMSATSLNIILSMIGGIQSFDLFYLFQTNGNLTLDLTPVGVLIFKTGLGSTNLRNIYLARSVTMSIVLTLIIATVTVLINKVFSRSEDK